MPHVKVSPGDRIALLLPGSVDYVELVIGLPAAGMFPVPLDQRLTPYERSRILEDIDARMVVDDPAVAASMLEHTPARHRRGRPWHDPCT